MAVRHEQRASRLSPLASDNGVVIFCSLGDVSASVLQAVSLAAIGGLVQELLDGHQLQTQQAV